MIAPNAPIDRIDIAFIICFLVHRKLVFIELSAIRTNRNQEPRILAGKFSTHWEGKRGQI
jgi:hypothetical protein